MSSLEDYVSDAVEQTWNFTNQPFGSQSVSFGGVSALEKALNYWDRRIW